MYTHLGVVVHTSNFNTWDAELQVALHYIVKLSQKQNNPLQNHENQQKPSSVGHKTKQKDSNTDLQKGGGVDRGGVKNK